MFRNVLKNRKASRLKRFEAFRFTAFPYPRGKGKAILLKPSEFFTKKIFAPPTLAFFPFLNRLRISADFFMCSQRLNVHRTLGVFSGKSVFINFQICRSNQYFLCSSATESFLRPFARRRDKIFRPPFVAILARKPNFLLRLTRLG